MLTATIQIGNSDDKLTQREWAQFIHDVHDMLRKHGTMIHFSGFSIPDAKWQNACWVAEMPLLDGLKRKLSELAERYKQDSIALTIGETEFIKP